MFIREDVIRNKDRIDTLYDMRKSDGDLLSKKLEHLVNAKISDVRQKHRPQDSENEAAFLRSRRSVRLWPVKDVGGLEKGVKRFLTCVLKMPTDVVENLVFQTIQKQAQARRSKIQEEVLVVLQTSQQRDTIQSFASNLASAQGQAGIRLDIPDYLRGLFRLFETHAAALRERYGSVKRAVRFDDAERSLLMDVKLEDAAWQRITAAELKASEEARKQAESKRSSRKGGHSAEKRDALLIDPQDEDTNTPTAGSGSEYMNN